MNNENNQRNRMNFAGFYTPNIIVDEYLEKIGVQAFTAYHLLSRCSNKQAVWEPSIVVMAAKMGCSRDAVKAALSVLIDYGLITCEAREESNEKVGTFDTTQEYILLEVPEKPQSAKERGSRDHAE